MYGGGAVRSGSAVYGGGAVKSHVMRSTDTFSFLILEDRIGQFQYRGDGVEILGLSHSTQPMLLCV